MIIKIREEDTKKYNEINNNLGMERNKIGDLLIYFEKEKESILKKTKLLQQDLQNSLINIIHRYKLKKKKITNVDMVKGEIEIEDK